MRDAIVLAGWRCVVLSLIFILTVLGCSLSLSALFGVTSGAWREAGTSLGIALLAGGAVAWLCAHRADLVEA